MVGMGKKKGKKKCCGKYLKKGKHCSKCPLLIKEKCKKKAEKKAAKKAGKKIKKQKDMKKKG